MVVTNVSVLHVQVKFSRLGIQMSCLCVCLYVGVWGGDGLVSLCYWLGAPYFSFTLSIHYLLVCYIQVYKILPLTYAELARLQIVHLTVMTMMCMRVVPRSIAVKDFENTIEPKG